MEEKNTSTNKHRKHTLFYKMSFSLFLFTERFYKKLKLLYYALFAFLHLRNLNGILTFSNHLIVEVNNDDNVILILINIKKLKSLIKM